MIPAPMPQADAAIPHLALTRPSKTTAGEFEALIAEFAGGSPMEDAPAETTEGAEDPAPHARRDTVHSPDGKTAGRQRSDTLQAGEARDPLQGPGPANDAVDDLDAARLQRIAARLTGTATKTSANDAGDKPTAAGEPDEEIAASQSSDRPATPPGIAREVGQSPAPATPAEPTVSAGQEPALSHPASPQSTGALAVEGSPTLVPAKSTIARAQTSPAGTPQRPAVAAQTIAPNETALSATGEPDIPGEARNWPDAARIDLRAARIAARGGPEGPVAETKPLGAITVTQRETHFAPVRRPAAIEEHQWRRQLQPAPKATPQADPVVRPAFGAVSDQLSQALEAARGEAEAKHQQAIQQAAPGARPLTPVKIIELSLQPASLGALAITMRLTGTGLRVTVAATSRETAELLREDREALGALIDGAGYQANEIIVTHRPPPQQISA